MNLKEVGSEISPVGLGLLTLSKFPRIAETTYRNPKIYLLVRTPPYSGRRIEFSSRSLFCAKNSVDLFRKLLIGDFLTSNNAIPPSKLPFRPRSPLPRPCDRQQLPAHCTVHHLPIYGPSGRREPGTGLVAQCLSLAANRTKPIVPRARPLIRFPPRP